MKTTAFAPASIGNLSVGFDILGAAIAPIDGTELGDKVTISDSDFFSFSMTGSWSKKLSDLEKNGKKNLAQACGEYFLDQLPKEKRKSIKIELFKNMPVGSGLGSSASSIVATFVALNNFFDKAFDNKELIKMMGELEGRVSGSVHYDNVAPAFLGGIQMITLTKNEICTQIPHFEDWYWVIAYSGISLVTSEMRKILPNSYPRNTMIDFAKNLGAFIQASYRKNEKMALEVLKDLVAEPYRKGKIPGFEAACKKMKEIGMLASGISGSGPSMFSITKDLNKAKEAEKLLNSCYVQNPDGFVHICKIR